MRHTNEEIEEAAQRFEKLADELDPGSAGVEAVEDLKLAAEASDAVRCDEVRLREAVENCRAQGRSWNQTLIFQTGATSSSSELPMGYKDVRECDRPPCGAVTA